MKITFVITSLSSTGGAQRVLSTMANYWAKKGHSVSIVTFDDGNKPHFFNLSSEIKHEALDFARFSPNLTTALCHNLKGLIRLKSCFSKHKPDLVISFLYKVNILVLLSTMLMKVPVIVSERNNPSSLYVHPVRRMLRACLYSRAKAVVFQTQAMLDSLPNIARKNGVVIPNPVLQPKIDNEIINISLPAGPLLLAIGGMSKSKIHQKGFDLLIPVFRNLAETHDDWNLVILGDGRGRQALVDMVHNYGLINRVFLPGKVKDVQSILSKGDLFVLSSRFEGFPNVLCEAMASSLPAVSFDCPTGPSDIIREGVDGVLVPPGDTVKLQEELSRLMYDQNLRLQMGENAKDILERFGLESIMLKWEELFN